MTFVLLTVTKIQIQVDKFGFKIITVETTTNITKIQKYMEQSLVELPFKVATKIIAKTGTDCIGISLQKAQEEVFHQDIIQRYASTLNPILTVRGLYDRFTLQKKVTIAKFIEMVRVRRSDKNQ